MRMMQQNLRSAPTMNKRVKSVYAQKNLGTIKDKKREKKEKKEGKDSGWETIMRILRMRHEHSAGLALKCSDTFPPHFLERGRATSFPTSSRSWLRLRSNNRQKQRPPIAGQGVVGEGSLISLLYRRCHHSLLPPFSHLISFHIPSFRLLLSGSPYSIAIQVYDQASFEHALPTKHCMSYFYLWSLIFLARKYVTMLHGSERRDKGHRERERDGRAQGKHRTISLGSCGVRVRYRMRTRWRQELGQLEIAVPKG